VLARVSGRWAAEGAAALLRVWLPCLWRSPCHFKPPPPPHTHTHARAHLLVVLRHGLAEADGLYDDPGILEHRGAGQVAEGGICGGRTAGGRDQRCIMLWCHFLRRCRLLPAAKLQWCGGASQLARTSCGRAGTPWISTCLLPLTTQPHTT
jgi:hypothetical protein